jgi:hypothetical protein
LPVLSSLPHSRKVLPYHLESLFFFAMPQMLMFCQPMAFLDTPARLIINGAFWVCTVVESFSVAQDRQ